jgi:hypothetical protein
MPLIQTLILLPAVSAPVVSAELRTTPTVFRSVVAFAGRTKIDLSAEVRPPVAVSRATASPTATVPPIPTMKVST